MIVNPGVFNSSTRRCTVASKPILVCVSPLEPSMRLDDFCSVKTTGTKMVVGDGPDHARLSSMYTDVHFVPMKNEQSLAHYYSNADVVVCPNGLQGSACFVAQAACCGTPVAARPHAITDDLIIKHVTGEICDDIRSAIELCLKLDREMIEQLAHILFTRNNNLISHLS